MRAQADARTALVGRLRPPQETGCPAPTAGIAALAVAGFGCLALTTSFALKQLLTMGASVAGGVIAFYQ
jgi:hypothetical protein